NAAQVTSYKCPSPPSSTAVTLSATVDDDPHAVDPGTQQTISTRDDAAATGDHPIWVGGPPAPGPPSGGTITQRGVDGSHTCFPTCDRRPGYSWIRPNSG